MVRKIRAKLVLQLRAEGLSGRAIAASQGMARKSVSAVLDAADRAGIGFHDVAQRSEAEVYGLLFPGWVMLMVVVVTIPPKNPVMATGRSGGRDCDETNQAPMRSLPARPAPVDSRPVGDRSTARTGNPASPGAVSRMQGSARQPTALILTVVGVADGTDGGERSGVGEPFAVADRGELAIRS